jgi:hypothetical protein
VRAFFFAALGAAFDGEELTDETVSADIIDAHVEDERIAIYQYLSENDSLAVHRKTVEEGIQQKFDYLKIALERDIRNKKEKGEIIRDEDELRVKYPAYTQRLAEMNQKYLGVSAGYRRLTCMPTFMLGLVQASRIRRHYTHAPWFRVTNFNKMLEVHGGMSGATTYRTQIWTAR